MQYVSDFKYGSENNYAVLYLSVLIKVLVVHGY